MTQSAIDGMEASGGQVGRPMGCEADKCADLLAAASSASFGGQTGGLARGFRAKLKRGPKKE